MKTSSAPRCTSSETRSLRGWSRISTIIRCAVRWSLTFRRTRGESCRRVALEGRWPSRMRRRLTRGGRGEPLPYGTWATSCRWWRQEGGGLLVRSAGSRGAGGASPFPTARGARREWGVQIPTNKRLNAAGRRCLRRKGARSGRRCSSIPSSCGPGGREWAST